MCNRSLKDAIFDSKWPATSLMMVQKKNKKINNENPDKGPFILKHLVSYVLANHGGNKY